jgi:hypothetical protein
VTLGAAFEYAIIAESRAAGCGARLSTGPILRVQHWVEHLQPAFNRLVTASGCNEEIARAGRFGSVLIEQESHGQMPQRMRRNHRRRALTRELNASVECSVAKGSTVPAGKN